MIRTIRVSPSLSSVISNLRSVDPRLADPSIADWRIEMAHRHYSTSEDYGDDTKVFEWLPEDTEENQWNYVQNYQIPDLLRTQLELEKYIAQLKADARSLRQDRDRFAALTGSRGAV